VKRAPLSTVAAARINGLVNSMLNQAENDLHISEAMNRASELPSVEYGLALLKAMDEGQPVPDLQKWPDRQELIIAIDAKRAKSDVPFYVMASHERHVNRIRARENAPQTGTGARGYVLPGATPRPAAAPKQLNAPEEIDS
jgi:hypothetical protein